MTMMPLLPISATLCTWFGVGRWRGATGTWGSIAALPFCAAIVYMGGTWALFVSATLLTILAIWLSGIYAKHLGDSDPKQIVLDEVVGQMFTLCVVPLSWHHYILGLLLFRVFDIVKPWPVSYIDQHWRAGYGIVGDDVAAAVYAATCLWLLERYML